MFYRIPKDTEMTPELLAKYIAQHKSDVAKDKKPLQDAYENKYEIYRLPNKPAYKPDNRISVNFAKYITDTFNGFFCGNPIRATSDDESVTAFLEYLDQYNDQDNNNAELAKIADIHGSSHEMYFTDEDGEIGITYLSPMESFFLVDDSILERPMYFIRYYTDAEDIERGSWSDKSVVQDFVNIGGYRWDGEAKEHGFDDVPATEYDENDEQAGIFESVLPMINAYNKAISEKANDVDYFADAYLKVLGERLSKGELEQLRDKRVINFYGTGERTPVVEFLAKPNGDSTQENLVNRLERLIFQTSMVANISDDNFGTSSGIALRYKLLSMSNLAKAKERKFASGMNRRYRVIFSHPVAQTKGVHADDWVKVHTHFYQNFPANISDEAEIAGKLEGIVSQETQLKVLSIVDDVQAEIERIQKQQEEARKKAMDQAVEEQRLIAQMQTPGGTDDQGTP